MLWFFGSGRCSSELAPQKTYNSFQRGFIALKMCPGLSHKCVAMCMFSQPHSALFKKTSRRIALFRDSVSGLTRTLNHIIIISSMKTRLCSGGNARSSRRVLLGCMCFLGRRFMERKKLLIYCKEKIQSTCHAQQKGFYKEGTKLSASLIFKNAST